MNNKERAKNLILPYFVSFHISYFFPIANATVYDSICSLHLSLALILFVIVYGDEMGIQHGDEMGIYDGDETVR